MFLDCFQLELCHADKSLFGSSNEWLRALAVGTGKDGPHITVSCRCATAASPRVKGSQVDDMAVAKNEFRADRCQGGVCKLRRLKALYTKFRYK